MTDIEAKALALINEVRRQYPNAPDYTASHIAICRTLEQHEAFKQEVSDAVTALLDRFLGDMLSQGVINGHLHQFIIPKPKPKPDPLVEAMTAALGEGYEQLEADNLRAMLEARGLEIREKGK